ncbi:hypothetical protein A1F97_07361 [Pyrenophora tritici-repentis]|nr:hypothetical protein A1F97_07361 [Pyrenophora tritici-repentis]
MATGPPVRQQQSRFMSLPRELRNGIYTYYFQVPGGYAHSPTTNRLRCSKDQPVDLSLIRTCKQIADETRNLPLQVNEIVFKSFHEVSSTSDDNQNIHKKLRSVNQLTDETVNEMVSTVANIGWLPWIMPTEDQITVLRDLFKFRSPEGLGGVHQNTIQSHRWDECRVIDAVDEAIKWINEATSLTSSGVTPQSLTIHFDGPYDTVQLIWNRIKSIGALYTAAKACSYNQCFPFLTLNDPEVAFIRRNSHAFSNPDLLPKSVRLILFGDSLVRLPCILGTVEEFEEECEIVYTLLKGRPHEDWEKHRDALLEGLVPDSENFRAMQLQYADYAEPVILTMSAEE